MNKPEPEILDFAKKAIAARGKDLAGYSIFEVKPVVGKPGRWFVLLDKPDSCDAQVELILDWDKKSVISYQDMWA